MDIALLVAAAASFGLTLGACFVGYAVISRWPRSPHALQNAIADQNLEIQRLQAAWATERQALEEIIETLESRSARLEQASRRKEKATQQQQQTTTDPLTEQMNQLAASSGVLARTGRH